MNIRVSTSTAAIEANLEQFLKDIRAGTGKVIDLRDVGYTVAPTSAVVLLAPDEDSDDEAADMASLRSNLTGVDNTVFVSTKGSGRHAARIKIAIDPPDSLNATSKTASMAIHDYGTVGAYVPTHIVEQAKKFIERNRDALIAFWECQIDTDELIKRLKKP